MHAVRVKLERLQAGLAGESDFRTHQPMAAESEPEPTDEITTVIQELQNELSAATEDIEEAVAAHPIAALASALLLGIVIGHVLGRMK